MPYYDRFTKALLHFDGANGSTTFTDEIGNAITPTGNSCISTSDRKIGNASGYFDGAGDYLTFPSSVLRFGVLDFTVEFWANILTNTQQWPYFIVSEAYNGGAGFYMITNGPATGWGGSGQMTFTGASGLANGGSVTTTSVIRNAGWKHISINRIGVTTLLFVNGILEASHTAAAIANYLSNYAYLSRSVGSSSDNEKFYIDELIISAGAALRTQNFTPPATEFTRLADCDTYLCARRDRMSRVGVSLGTPPLAAADSVATCLLLFQRQPFVDEMGNAVTTYGDTKILKDPCAGSQDCGYFDGNGDYLLILPQSECNFGNTFTFEVELYRTADTNGPMLGHDYNRSFGESTFSVDTNGTLSISQGNNAGQNWNDGVWSSLSVPLGQLSHVAAACDNGTMRIFINGVHCGTDTGWTWIQKSSGLKVGFVTVPSYGVYTYFKGFIAKVRITKGVARWTADFAPPTLFGINYLHARRDRMDMRGVSTQNRMA